MTGTTPNVDTIIQGDCREEMKKLPDGCIDLTVTSPPYDNLRKYNGYVFDFEGIAQQLFRITKSGGVVVWVVGDATIDGSETGTSFRQALYFKEIGFKLHDTMIYQKAGGGANGDMRGYIQSFEFMFILSKDRPKSTNCIEDRRNVVPPRIKIERQGRRKPNGDKKGFRLIERKEFGKRTNVWTYNVGNNSTTTDRIAFDHPAIFPEQLAADHILSWSNPDDLILDPMCGSGTTCKMAKYHQRHFLGYDISEEYCEIARKRVAAVPARLDRWAEAEG